MSLWLHRACGMRQGAWTELRTLSQLTLKTGCSGNGAGPTQGWQRSRLFHGAVIHGNAAIGVPDGTKFPSKVLMLGAGGVSIGQAPALDFFGAQAIRALKEENISTVLLNPNIAAMQTGETLANEVYFLPITEEYVEYVIKKECPDGILLPFSGQLGLHCGLQLARKGTLDKYGVQVVGSPIAAFEAAANKDLLPEKLAGLGIDMPYRSIVSTVDAAIEVAGEIGYPLLVHPKYVPGGQSKLAHNAMDLAKLAKIALRQDDKIILERLLKGWKSVQCEILRDAGNDCLPLCNVESLDLLGTLSGDSISVSPAQTLTGQRKDMLEHASANIMQRLGIVGNASIDFALHPYRNQFYLIGVSPLLSKTR
jgi:carbamoyl-phosphate synthase large subunit